MLGGRRARLLASLAALLAPALGCGWGGDRVNAAGFFEYAQEVCRASGVAVSARRCEMAPPGTRLGFCEVGGPETGRLPEVLGLSAADEETTRGWATSYNSGCAEGGWTAQHPGARLYLVPEETSIPPSHGNGKLHRIWIDGGEVCFDLSYPYG